MDVPLELAEGVIDVGLKLQVTLLFPEAHVNVTELLNPFSDAMVTVEEADAPGAMLAGDAAEAEI